MGFILRRDGLKRKSYKFGMKREGKITKILGLLVASPFPNPKVKIYFKLRTLVSMGWGIKGLAIYLLKPKIFGIENLALMDRVLNPFKISARFSINFRTQ